MYKKSFPEVLPVNDAYEFIKSEAGHSMYTPATLRRYAHEGKLKYKQMGKKHKMFLFKSDIMLKLLDPDAM